MFPIDKFTFHQNEVFCSSFSCKNCRKFLFNSADIVFQTCYFDRLLLFTKKLETVEVFRSNSVRCKRCHMGLGGMVFRDWTIGNHLIRFPSSTLQRDSIQLSGCNYYD